MTNGPEYSKSDLIGDVFDRHRDIDLQVVEALVNSTLDILKRSINIQERVELHGFGVFHVRERAAEAGVMPEGMIHSAGVEFNRPADFTVEFEPSQDFYDLLNEKED